MLTPRRKTTTLSYPILLPAVNTLFLLYKSFCLISLYKSVSMLRIRTVFINFLFLELNTLYIHPTINQYSVNKIQLGR